MNNEDLPKDFFERPKKVIPKGCKTLREWSDEGRRIRKGAKAAAFNDRGEAVFHPLDTYAPVVFSSRRHATSSPDPGWDWDGGYWQDAAEAEGFH